MHELFDLNNGSHAGDGGNKRVLLQSDRCIQSHETPTIIALMEIFSDINIREIEIFGDINIREMEILSDVNFKNIQRH